MFNFSSSSTLLAGRHDVTQERDAPSLPTVAVFPPPFGSDGALPEQQWQEESLFGAFARLKKPADMTPGHLACLDMRFDDDGDEAVAGFERLVPEAHLPPPSWLEPPPLAAATVGPTQPQPGPPEGPKSPETLLSNGRPAPTRTDFETRAKELHLDRHDAFASLSRKPSSGQSPIRLAHFRRFWEGLDNMAYYWDTSRDEYIPPKQSDSDDVSAPPEDKLERMNMVESEPRKKPKRSMDEPPSTSTDKPTGTYRGLRVGNGFEMPDQYRAETVRGFLEPILWAYGVTMMPHRRTPQLEVGPLRLPVRLSTTAWRAAADRMRARAGYIEGPIMGIQCRNELGDTLLAPSTAILDRLREVSALIFLAQERAREGRTERKPGEGKWWTTTPRWGGGPGGEVGEGKGPTDDPPQVPAAATTAQTPAIPSTRSLGAPSALVSSSGHPLPSVLASLGRLGYKDKDRRKTSAAEIWKTLRCGASLWDPKTTYHAIGKAAGSEVDEVYLVSSLNHHISLLKLTVHPSYLARLDELARPSTTFSSLPPLPDSLRPVFQRTRWYDLFDRNDRLEVMRGLWGVVGYLMRVQEDGTNGPDGINGGTEKKGGETKEEKERVDASMRDA